MRVRRIVALVWGLLAFAEAGLFVYAAAYSYGGTRVVLFGTAAAMLILIGFECCRYAFTPADEEYRPFSGGYRGLLFRQSSTTSRKILALVVGLAAFAEAVVSGIMAANIYPLWRVILLGTAAATFIPIGFEGCRYAFAPPGREYRAFSGGYRTLVFDLVSLLVALCLTITTVSFQRSQDILCGGSLGAGLPLAFVCDNAGESPISSWGKFDWADIDHLSIPGTFVDVMFYLVLLSVSRSALIGLFDRNYPGIRSRLSQ